MNLVKKKKKRVASMKHKNTEPQYNEHWQFEWLKTTAGGKKTSVSAVDSHNTDEHTEHLLIEKKTASKAMAQFIQWLY